MALCRMFNQAICGEDLPVRLSFDHDPLFQFQRWQANLRILGVETVQTVPLVPCSHPFVERLIGSLRREDLGHPFYLNAGDLERKLELFRRYFNATRAHQGLGGDTRRRKPGVQRRRWPDLRITAGKAIVTVWFTCQLLPDQQFAMYRCSTIHIGCWAVGVRPPETEPKWAAQGVGMAVPNRTEKRFSGLLARLLTQG